MSNTTVCGSGGPVKRCAVPSFTAFMGMMLALGCGAGSATDAGPDAADGPVDFGPNVLVFDPSMPMATIQEQIDAIFNKQLQNQFGAARYAFLFRPGNYTLDIRVAYYTQVLGLGQSPDDVVITGAVRVNDKKSVSDPTGPVRSTSNFWRSAENLTVIPTVPTPAATTNTWSVSQATSLRRVHIKGNLALSESGNSSGGFLADSLIDGGVSSGSQQQWFTRNTDLTSWSGQNWNMVFAGVPNAPTGAWPANKYTVIPTVPVIREKPYLYLDSKGSYAVMVPSLKTDTQGRSWSTGPPAGTSVPLAQFFVAHADKDTAATMNAALAQGKHLLLTPGVYKLDDSLEVSRADTMVIGLGVASLAAQRGVPTIAVADVDGVKLAGFLVEAGPMNSPTVLQLGPAPSALDHSKNPTLLYDVSCRVGGATDAAASSCLIINSNDVIADNLWLWRADHDITLVSVVWTDDPSKNGLVVNGKNVTAYALMVEHFQEYQTLWNGNGGRVYFYQSEMPYDPPNQSAWMNGATKGYASYKVSNQVTTHDARGLGVYCNFKAPLPSPVFADNAFEAPQAVVGSMQHLITVFLNNFGGINHVLNGTGNAVLKAGDKATVN